jgi:hypothetical protein
MIRTAVATTKGIHSEEREHYDQSIFGFSFLRRELISV